MSIFQFSVRDHDAGPEGDVSLNISSGNIDNIFEIEYPGNLKVVGNLDYESGLRSYQLLINAEDNSTTLRKRNNVTVTINVLNVNEFEPEFLNYQPVMNISEDATSLTLVSCHIPILLCFIRSNV